MTNNNSTSVAMNQELGLLNSDIKTTEGEIKKLEAQVTGLTQQQSNAAQYLDNANSNHHNAKINKGFVDQVSSGIIETVKKTNLMTVSTLHSGQSIKSTAGIMAELIKQLVYSIELIDTLAITINKNKQANILIPDDLVDTITAAGSDANNAMALSLTALQSCCVSMTVSEQVKSITIMEYIQSLELYAQLSGNTQQIKEHVGKLNGLQALKLGDAQLQELIEAIKAECPLLTVQTPDREQTSLINLLVQAEVKAEEQLTTAKDVKGDIDGNLARATSELENQQTKLESLQAGLTAATAAVMAA